MTIMWTGTQFSGQNAVQSSDEITPYFTALELACPKKQIVQCEPVFLAALSTLRHTLDHALTLNSACRSPEYNQQLNDAHPRSLHQTLNPVHKNKHTQHPLMCCAADVKTRGWPNEKIKRFVKVAEQQGWSVRIARNFIHIDRRELAGLPQHRGYYGSAQSWYESI